MMLQQNPKGYRPIHRAVVENRSDELVRQLGHKAELDSRTQNGSTPLHVAIELGHARMAHILLAYHADPNAHDHQGRTPLHLAATLGHTELAIDLLSNDRCEVNVQDTAGMTPLHLAVAGEQVEMVKVLLAHRADVAMQNTAGDTPLHEAVEHGQVAAVELLLTYQADANAGNHVGRTPLLLAAKQGWVEVTDRLLAAGAKINAKDQLGRTPLHEAAMRGHLAIAEMLLRHGADMLLKDSQGRTPYFLAGLSNQHEMMTFLRKYSQQHPIPEAECMPVTAPAPAAPTDIQCVQTRLEQQSRMFEEMLNAIPDHVVILDRQYRFTFVNSSAARALGRRQEECVGKSWQTLGLLAEGMLPLMELCRAVFAGGSARRREFAWPTVIGMQQADCQASPIHRGDGEVGMVLCVVRDITVRRRTDAVLAGEYAMAVGKPAVMNA